MSAMDIVRLPAGQSAPTGAASIVIRRLADRWQVTGSVLGADSVAFMTVERASMAAAEDCGIAWAEGEGVAALYIELAEREHRGQRMR